MPCRSLYRTALLGSVVVVAFAAEIAFPEKSWAQQKDVTATATLVIIKWTNDTPNALAGVQKAADDFGPTHIAILKSPYIVERAIKKRNLAALKSLEKTADPVATIRENFSVKQNPPGTSVLLLNYRGSTGDDCEKILGAIIESFEDYFEETTRHAERYELRALTDARDKLKEELTRAERDYETFRAGAVAWHPQTGGDTVILERIKSLEQRKTELMLNQIDARGNIRQIELQPEGLNAHLLAREWATKIGYESLPEEIRKKTDLVAAYRAHLQDTIDRSAAIQAEIDRAIEKQNAELNRRNHYAIKERQFVAEIRRLETLFEQTATNLQRVGMTRERNAITVIRVLAAPKAAKTP